MTTQPPNKSQPREFWIDHDQWYSEDEKKFNDRTCTPEEWNPASLVHVIEYKAIEALQVEIERISQFSRQEGARLLDAQEEIADLTRMSDGQAKQYFQLLAKFNERESEVQALQAKLEVAEKRASFAEHCWSDEVHVAHDLADKFRDERDAMQTKLEKAKAALNKMHHCCYHSLLDATAWMGIPEKKRDAFIEDHMSNARFIRDQALADLNQADKGEG